MRGLCAAPLYVLIWWNIKRKKNTACEHNCHLKYSNLCHRQAFYSPSLSLPCSDDRMSPLPDSNLPEQTGERMRGGAVPAAVAASTGARRAAAGARRLPLPGQELLHRGEVPRPRRLEKFLLLPHRESHGIQRRRGEEKRKRGAWVSGVEFLFSLCSLSLSPQLPTSSYFSALLVRWRGNKSSLRPLVASLRIHGAAGARGGGKVSLSTTVPPPPPPSKLPLTSPGRLVRHFLETAVPRIYNLKPSRRHTHTHTHIHARTQTHNTTHNSLYPRLSCFTEKVDG